MVNLFTRSTLVKASSGLAPEAKNIVDGSPETTWTSAGDPASELDPSSVEHTLWFSLRPDGDRSDSDEEDDWDDDDGDDDDAPSNQFAELERLQSLSLTFQGGYSAISVTLSAKIGSTWTSLAQVWPEDSNATQIFALTGVPSGRTSTLQLALHGSTDSFGRITLYGAALEAQS